MKTLRALVAAALVVATFGIAVAKLPPPAPPTEEQKKAAEEKKAKDAVAAEAAKGQQGRAEDRVAARYFADMKAKGKEVPAAQMPPAAAAPPSSVGNVGTMKGVSSQPEKAMAHSPTPTKR